MTALASGSFPCSVGLAVLAAAACIDVGALKRPTGSGGAVASAGKGGAPGAGGNGGGGGTGGPPRARSGILLVPEIDGTFNEQNAAGVRGYWWSTGDLYGGDSTSGTGTCPMAGFPPEKCSLLTTPTPGTPFRPGPGGMCTSGIAARVQLGSDGQPAWSAIWGNIVGFTLASDSQSDAGFDGWGTYDAPAHGISGLSFGLAEVPPDSGLLPRGHMRVSFATKGTELNPPFWRGALDDLSPINSDGPYEILWSEIGGPSYLANPPPFDPSMLEAIRFDVVSNDQAPIPYSFCITNVALLTH